MLSGQKQSAIAKANIIIDMRFDETHFTERCEAILHLKATFDAGATPAHGDTLVKSARLESVGTRNEGRFTT